MAAAAAAARSVSFGSSGLLLTYHAGVAMELASAGLAFDRILGMYVQVTVQVRTPMRAHARRFSPRASSRASSGQRPWAPRFQCARARSQAPVSKGSRCQCSRCLVPQCSRCLGLDCSAALALDATGTSGGAVIGALLCAAPHSLQHAVDYMVGREWAAGMTLADVWDPAGRILPEYLRQDGVLPPDACVCRPRLQCWLQCWRVARCRAGWRPGAVLAAGWGQC